MRRLLPLIISSIIATSTYGQELYYPPTNSAMWESMTISEAGWCEDQLPELRSFLAETNSLAFIVLKEGRIVIEEYLDGFGQDSVWYWASAGKSLKAFEIGMLQEEASRVL